MKNLNIFFIFLLIFQVFPCFLSPVSSSADKVIVDVPDASIRNGLSADFQKAGDAGKEKVQKDDLEISLKVIKPLVNIRQSPSISARILGSVKENDILAGLGEDNSWYHCRTKEGIEGWIIDWACELIPVRSFAAKSKISTAIIKTNEVSLRAGPNEAYPLLGSLSMGKEVDVYLKEAGWIYIKGKDGQTEGWISSDLVYDSIKNINLNIWKDDIFKISDTLSKYYDKKKMELRRYKDVNWYPSIKILQKGKDISIEPLSEGWKIKLTLSLRNISIETLFPLSMETASFSLTEADRLFFLMLIQALMDNVACEEVEITLRGLKKGGKGSTLKWIIVDHFSINRSMLSGIDLNKIKADSFWDLLAHE